MLNITLRRAKSSDAAAVTACVCEADVHCIERIGYLEYGRRVVNGFPRVFFRKALG